MPVIPDQETMQSLPPPKRSKPLFDPNEITVIFVLGGPGAGKGTQCEHLVRDFGFKHLSAGDLLREEQKRPGSEFGEEINTCIKEGKIVRSEVTVQLLENAMVKAQKEENKTKFLIDGFPRQMDQALIFERDVCASRFILFFNTTEEVMRKRLLNRGKTSGRADDNEESIKKRFKTFVDTSMPVVEYYRKDGKVVEIDSTPSPDEVHADIKKQLIQRDIRPSNGEAK